MRQEICSHSGVSQAASCLNSLTLHEAQGNDEEARSWYARALGCREETTPLGMTQAERRTRKEAQSAGAGCWRLCTFCIRPLHKEGRWSKSLLLLAGACEIAQQITIM